MPASVNVNGSETTASHGSTLFACAKAVGVRVPTSCFENGKCRECLVEVEHGMELLSERTPEEEHLDGSFRLSCRTTIQGEGEIRCHTLRRGALRIEEDSGLASDLHLDPGFVRDGKNVRRDGAAFEESEEPLYGLAVDLGTTTVVLRLHDLESGRLVATSSFENPQRFGGSDIMARIRYDGEHRGRLLQRTALGYLSHAIGELPFDPARIVEVVVTGNPTMRDLLFGLDVSTIGVDPYRSITEAELLEGTRTTTSLVTPARKLRLPVHASAEVYGMPLIASHVGADAAAAMLATDLARGSGVSVLMDIGTNTELVVGNRDRLLAASCPAGPAFEGGAIRFGMAALEGAIERVTLDEGRASCTVIGGGAPVGICGSGLVDALGELLRTGAMNAQGRLDDDTDELVLDEARGITLSEADINELAQAKGANAAGLRAVLDRYGVEATELDRFYLAGGFAQHIDLDAARRIGLIPDLPDEKFVRIGNAAVVGASRVLTSRSERRYLEEVVRRIEHVRLETHPSFFDFFVDGCQFTPIPV